MVKKRPVEILRSALCHVAQGVSLRALELSPGTRPAPNAPCKFSNDFRTEGLSKSSSCPCLAFRMLISATMAAAEEGSRWVQGRLCGPWGARGVTGACGAMGTAHGETGGHSGRMDRKGTDRSQNSLPRSLCAQPELHFVPKGL